MKKQDVGHLMMQTAPVAAAVVMRCAAANDVMRKLEINDPLAPSDWRSECSAHSDFFAKKQENEQWWFGREP